MVAALPVRRAPPPPPKAPPKRAPPARCGAAARRGAACNPKRIMHATPERVRAAAAELAPRFCLSLSRRSDVALGAALRMLPAARAGAEPAADAPQAAMDAAAAAGGDAGAHRSKPYSPFWRALRALCVCARRRAQALAIPARSQRVQRYPCARNALGARAARGGLRRSFFPGDSRDAADAACAFACA